MSKLFFLALDDDKMEKKKKTPLSRVLKWANLQ